MNGDIFGTGNPLLAGNSADRSQPEPRCNWSGGTEHSKPLTLLTVASVNNGLAVVHGLRVTDIRLCAYFVLLFSMDE